MSDVLTELLRLYDWRNELANQEAVLETPARRLFTEEEVARTADQWGECRRQTEQDLRRYGREKKAAWIAARKVLTGEDRT